MVKENKISVHPSRVPVTLTHAGDAIHAAQKHCSSKLGVDEGWSQQVWKHLFEHFASPKRRASRASVDVTEIFKDIVAKVKEKKMIDTRLSLTKKCFSIVFTIYILS